MDDFLWDRELTWDIRAVDASDIPCPVFGAGEEEGIGEIVIPFSETF